MSNDSSYSSHPNSNTWGADQNGFPQSPQSPQSFPTCWVPPNPCSMEGMEKGCIQVGFSKFCWSFENGTYSYSWISPWLGTYSWQSCDRDKPDKPKFYSGKFHLLEKAYVKWEIHPDQKKAFVFYCVDSGEDIWKELSESISSYPFPDKVATDAGTYGKVGSKPILTARVDWDNGALSLDGTLGYTAKTTGKKVDQEVFAWANHNIQSWE